MKDKRAMMFGVIGLLVGVLATWATAATAVNGGHSGMMSMMGMHYSGNSASDDSDLTMGQMTNSLKNKDGDVFDKAFLNEMIMHHQGAIDMAKLAKAHAKHQEIKTIASNIITAQGKEIDQMTSWQSQWEYGTMSSHMNTSH